MEGHLAAGEAVAPVAGKCYAATAKRALLLLLLLALTLVLPGLRMRVVRHLACTRGIMHCVIVFCLC
jgi:hypothetical protein